MEYRAQTYFGALQLLAVIAGSLFLRVAVKSVDDMLAPSSLDDPLKFLRPLSHFGWTLIVIPIAWVVSTIEAERSDHWWASKSLTITSGLLILLGISGLFGWAGWNTCSILW